MEVFPPYILSPSLPQWLFFPLLILVQLIFLFRLNLCPHLSSSIYTSILLFCSSHFFSFSFFLVSLSLPIHFLLTSPSIPPSTNGISYTSCSFLHFTFHFHHALLLSLSLSVRLFSLPHSLQCPVNFKPIKF